VNDSRSQIIFNSYKDLRIAFETTDKAIREAEYKCSPLRNNVTGAEYYVDKLFSEKDLYNAT
jgi:hypothetical protein